MAASVNAAQKCIHEWMDAYHAPSVVMHSGANYADGVCEYRERVACEGGIKAVITAMGKHPSSRTVQLRGLIFISLLSARSCKASSKQVETKLARQLRTLQ